MRYSLSVFTLAGVLLLSVAPVKSGPPLSDDPRLWADFLRESCSLIEQVPIVAPPPSPLIAVLSSVIGYYEHQFPTLAPLIPGRRRALGALPLFQTLGSNDRDYLSKVLEANADKHLEAFLRVAEAHPDKSLGQVRGYVLQEHQRRPIEEIIEAYAKARLLTVAIDRARFEFPQTFKVAVDAKTPVILRVGNDVYVGVGYFERSGSVIVVDPRVATAKSVPASQALLTERDRVSDGELSTFARKILADRKIVIDELTACAEQKPAGLRFVKERHFRDAEMYVVHGWALDTELLKQKLLKRKQ